MATGVAIQNYRLHDRVRALSVLDDRDRIARDLHDRVIQRIYAVGMSLAGAARLDDLPLVHDRVERAVDDLDSTITEIRTAIFELGDTSLPGGLRHAVVHLADELTPTLGMRPEGAFRRSGGQRRSTAGRGPHPRRRPRGTDQRGQACPGLSLRRRDQCGRRHRPRRGHRQRQRPQGRQSGLGRSRPDEPAQLGRRSWADTSRFSPSRVGAPG